MIPDQLVDYTWGREHTYTGDSRFSLLHVEFTVPFSASLRKKLLVAASAAGLNVLSEATYGATQGPRLESAAARATRPAANRKRRNSLQQVALLAGDQWLR